MFSLGLSQCLVDYFHDLLDSQNTLALYLTTLSQPSGRCVAPTHTMTPWLIFWGKAKLHAFLLALIPQFSGYRQK